MSHKPSFVLSQLDQSWWGERRIFRMLLPIILELKYDYILILTLKTSEYHYSLYLFWRYP